MTYMLDMNICIYVIKHKLEQVFQHMQENLQKGLCISAITLAELEHGIEKSSYPEKNRAALTRFLVIIDVLPFDELAANEYGKVCAYLQRQGTFFIMRTGGLLLVAGNTKSREKEVLLVWSVFLRV